MRVVDVVSTPISGLGGARGVGAHYLTLLRTHAARLLTEGHIEGAAHAVATVCGNPPGND
jgi:hypothetical protein